MTDDELDELVKKASRATVGPWVANGQTVNNALGAQISYQATIISSNDNHTIYEEQAVKNTEYIAAINPLVVIELIDDLHRKQKECACLANQLNHICKMLSEVSLAFKQMQDLHLDDIDWIEYAKVVADD